jgi:uncharacterized protein (TIGR02453 family)
MIQQRTLDFIKALSKNNNKEWFETNRGWYNEARSNFEEFIQEVIDAVLQFDTDLQDQTAKKAVFRQHRDIRFSKDKTPYKPHFGAHLGRGGKSSKFAGYYFHFEPGNRSMVGGGIWMPEAEELKKIRQEIDYSFADFQKIISAKPFKETYGQLDDSSESKLVKLPKGYDKNNPAIEYLKLKSVIAVKMISDEELTSPGLKAMVVKAFKTLNPLVKFINQAVE